MVLAREFRSWKVVVDFALATFIPWLCSDWSLDNSCSKCSFPFCVDSWVLVALNSLSWIFSVVTLASCSFIDGGVGLFSIEDYYGKCESYKASDLPSVQTARAFGILQNLSLVFSMSGLLSVIFCLSDNAARWVWLATKILYCFTLFCTLLVFIAFAECEEGYDCKPGAAAIINILNVFLLIGMVSVCWYVPIPSAPIFHCCGGIDDNSRPPPKNQSAIPVARPSTKEAPSPIGGTVVTRTVQDTRQGRKIIEEVTHPDGSKTITETLEQTVDDTMLEEEDVVLSQPPHSPVSTSRAPLYMSAAQPPMEVHSAPSAATPVYVPTTSNSSPQKPSYSPQRETELRSTSTRQSRAADPPGEAEYSPSIISTAL
jgi:hypothetical protein